MPNNNIWKIGLVIGLLGAMAGIISAMVVAPLIGTVVLVIMCAVFGLIWFIFLGPLFRNAKILKTGLPAQATILRIWDTGVTINDNPQLGLDLELSAEGRPNWTAKSKLVVSRLEVHQYKAGMTLHARFNPENPQEVAVSADYASPPPASEEELTQKLTEIQAFNQELNTFGDTAQAIVLEFLPMGINVNGNNPAATLKVKVLPENDEPFNAELSGVFGQEGLHKYQPGKEITVKYDKWNKDRVTVSF